LIRLYCNLVFIAITLSLAWYTLAAHAQVYKWVDERGVTHYESSPPPTAQGVKAKTLDIPATASTTEPSESWQDKDSAFQARYDQRKAQQAKEEAAQQKAQAARMSACLHAQTSLNNILRAGRVYRVDAQGNRVFLDEDQRTQEINALRQSVASNCNG